MAEEKPVEIVCSACGADTLLMRTPKYDGFKKVGEALTCSACGHVYEKEEDIPYKEKQHLRVFTDADRSADVKVFRENEQGRICRYCTSYIVNPFTQWCSVHKKEVEATDTCDRFEAKEEKPSPI